MTKDEIIALAKESGFSVIHGRAIVMAAAAIGETQ